MRKVALVLIAIFLFSGVDAAPKKGEHSFEGMVYEDANGNGIRDEYEVPIKGVAVSDGFSLVKSDSNGRFSIKHHPRSRFIAVYTPSGYVHTTSFYIDVREQAYGRGFEFGLKSVGEQLGRFVHMSDIEERVYLDWQDSFKHFVSSYPLDFVAVTGDICYTKGLILNGSAFNTPQMGVRMVYSLGNHDLIRGFKDAMGGEYGEKLYEDSFGPVWYSFNVAGVHYMVTPMLSGDAKPSYTSEDIFNWMRLDLSSIPKEMPVVIFNHAIMDGVEDLLSEYNIIGYVYGHNHINYHYRDSSGCQFICSVAPNKGGNDHSPSSFRIFTADASGQLSNALHYVPMPLQLTASAVEYGDSLDIAAVAYDGSSMVESVCVICAGAKTSMTAANDIIWKVRIPKCEGAKVGALYSDGQVRISEVSYDSRVSWSVVLGGKGYMGTPIVSGDFLYVPVVDDEASEECGVYALNKNTGKIRWFFKTSGSVRNNMVLSALSESAGVLYVADVNATVYALNAETGSLIWSRTVRKDGLYPLYSQGVCFSDGVVYMGLGHNLCALDASDGSVLWNKSGWTKGGITDVSTYAVGDGVLLGNGYWVGRYALNAATGSLLWSKRDADNRYSTSIPAFVDGHFIYTTSNALFEVEPRTGEVVRRESSPFSFNTRSKPTVGVTDGRFVAADSYGASSTSGVIDTLVVVGTSDHGMAAFKRSAFSQKWNFKVNPALVYTSPYTKSFEQTIEGSPVIKDGKVIFGANDGYIYCVTLDNGSYVWRYKVGLPVLADPVVDGEYIYVVDMGGRVLRLRRL